MEKRRRARINASLEQLKKLVLDATRKDVSTHGATFLPTCQFYTFYKPQ